MRERIARSMRFAAILVLSTTLSGTATAEDSQRRPECEGEGIWKSAIPRVPMRGEFANHDPIGLANGQKIKADCSLNWTDPDDHKLYCFNSATSLAYFLYWPKANARRARIFWEGLPLTR